MTAHGSRNDGAQQVEMHPIEFGTLQSEDGMSRRASETFRRDSGGSGNEMQRKKAVSARVPFGDRAAHPGLDDFTAFAGDGILSSVFRLHRVLFLPVCCPAG
jgi:hypothetical protein